MKVKLIYLLRDNFVPVVMEKAMAEQAIKNWVGRWTNNDKPVVVYDESSWSYAIDSRFIEGMYIAAYAEECAAERMAKAVEKMADSSSEGEEWKG